MRVTILATKDCALHLPALERELRSLGIQYSLQLVEEHPDLAGQLGVASSPNLIVDDELVFRQLPAMSELKSFFLQR